MPPKNMLLGAGLQRFPERSEDQTWLSARWTQAKVLMLNHQGSAAINPETRQAIWFDAADCLDCETHAWLGMLNDVPYFYAVASLSQFRQNTWLDLREAAVDWSAQDSGVFAYAKALHHWRQTTQFCSRCGSNTIFDAAGHVANCANPSCGARYFPRLDAAVIVLIRHGSACLLGRQPHWPAKRYSTFAGFVECGESLEQALHREMQEEVGLRLTKTYYIGSQPWPFPSSLMVGFIADVESRDVVLGEEIEHARWFTRDQLTHSVANGEVRLPPQLSISRTLIDGFLAKQW